jgi:hypothetical protein
MLPTILLMPVHNGGVFFENALVSAAPLLDWFDRVVISLNSADNSPDRRTLLRVLGSASDKIEVYETPQVLTAVRHLKHLFDTHLAGSLSPSSNVMLFFHDDVLDSNAFVKFVEHLESNPGTAVFGGWRTSRNGIEEDKFTFQIHPGETPDSWFERSVTSGQGHDGYTNASGIIVPAEAITAYLKWVPFTRGARMEHMLVSHKSVRQLLTSQDPYIVVSRHERQEGANVPPLQSLTDEILYQIWMFVNHRRVSHSSIRFGLMIILKAAASYSRQRARAAIKSRKRRNN